MWRTSGAMLYLYLLCLAVLMAASGYHRTILNFRAPTSYKKVARLYMRGDSDYTAVMIVPTGVGAKIGGYAGDALPSAKLLSTVVDQLITHPNVMNGAMMYWPKDNIMYVEGFALDQFAEGKLHLQPIGKRSNKIGLLLDKGIEEDIQIRHLHVANAARATLGIDVASCVITSRPVGVSLKVSDSGASWGVVEDTATLVEAAETLVKQGCDAIAVVVRFPEDEEIDSGVQQDSADSTVQVTIDRAGANPLTVAKGASSVNFAINMPHRKYLEEIQDQIDSSNLRTNFNVDGRSVTTEQDQTAERVQKSSPKTAKQLFEDYRNGCGVDAIAGVEAIISHVITKRLGIPCAHAPAFSSMDAGTCQCR